MVEHGYAVWIMRERFILFATEVAIYSIISLAVTRNFVLFFCPSAKVNKAAALATERAKFVFWFPNECLAAVGALYRGGHSNLHGV